VHGIPRGEEADVTDTSSRAFALTAAQERLLAEVGALAREVLAPLAEAGPPGRVNRALVRALGRVREVFA